MSFITYLSKNLTFLKLLRENAQKNLKLDLKNLYNLFMKI